MADPEHLAKIKEGIRVWNKWRKKNPDVTPDLSEANLEGVNLRGANLAKANLNWTDLRGANLEGANLRGTDLTYAEVKGRILFAF